MQLQRGRFALKKKTGKNYVDFTDEQLYFFS